MKRSFADIVREEAAENLRRLLLKLPEWACAGASLKIPSRLNLEQCSSSATARYKAALALRSLSLSKCSSANLADLTGGLGADSWAFSKAFDSVLYNEMSTELTAAVENNFQALGVQNVVFRNSEVQHGRIGEILDGYRPDIIFMDPARRGSIGQKVFRLEDCQPNVLELKDELLGLCPNLLLKLSPMADISLLCRQLGPEVREVHCVGTLGECKELLIWLQRGWTGGVSICVSEDLSRVRNSSEKDSASTSGLNSGFAPLMTFTPEEEAASEVKFFADGEELAVTAGLLFEPSAVTMKAGCFRLLCSRFGLTKLGRSTQLYVVNCGNSGSGGAVSEGVRASYDELCRLGKLFRIKRIVPFSGASAASVGREYPCCEVSARNMPLSSDELRRKMKCKSGGSLHIFGAGVDFAGAAAGFASGSVAGSGGESGIGRGAAVRSGRYLFVTERV